MVSMAIEGLGAAIIPLLAATPVPPKLKMYSLPVPLGRIIKVAIIRDALHTPAVFAFRDNLKKYKEIALPKIERSQNLN